MATKTLDDRRRALEDAFFLKENEKLLANLRANEERAEQRAALSATMKLSDEDVLDHLIDAGIRAETWLAISLVPLVEVAWRIAAGRDAAEEVAIAKHYASDAGYRVTFSAQHIHGGVGVDREYPVHRYYVYARHLELMLGGSTHHMRRLGKLIAASAA
jgi:alkylation response protein AidB-like acyl-CoA dehydrogenase